MLAGAIVVILWIVFAKPLGETNDFFNLYEIIPGIIASVLVTIIVSKMTKKPNIDVNKDMNTVKETINTEMHS